jgi:hypothetical protein
MARFLRLERLRKKPAVLVTILINNYNYGRFLADAIDSALGQTYSPVEVVVVDDGSSDHSRTVIAGYGDQIVPVMKANGGQASAFNAGFTRCRGRIVLLLDADDTLAPDTAARVVAVMQARPEVVRVQYRLALVDAEGHPTGETKPPAALPVPAGDLRQQVLDRADDIPWLPTSGNAFAAGVLERILPMPEDGYRICADYYLSNVSPLFGPIAALDGIGGTYRVHGANQHEAQQLQIDKIQENIRRTELTHRHLAVTACNLGLLAAASTPVGAHSLSVLANRLVSVRLDSARHPIPGDRPLPLAGAGVRTAWERRDLGLVHRVAYVLWFVLVAVLPRRVASYLAALLFHGPTGGTGRLLNRIARLAEGARG